MSDITLDTIEQVAALARLELTAKEKKQYAEQLSVVFDYMEMLNEVNTDDVEETCQVTGLEDVVREDVVFEVSDATKQKLIDAFPEKMGNLLKVKAVFSDSDDE